MATNDESRAHADLTRRRRARPAAEFPRTEILPMAKLKTLRTHAEYAGPFKATAQAREHQLVLDQPAPLGTNAGAMPLEFLQMALAGCFVGTGYLIARQRQLPVRSIRAEVTGTLDVEVAAGRSEAGRAGFTGLTVNVAVDADLSAKEKEAFIAEVQRRCPVSDNLEHPTPVNFALVQDEATVRAAN